MKPQGHEKALLLRPRRKSIVHKRGGEERCLPIVEMHTMLESPLDLGRWEFPHLYKDNLLHGNNMWVKCDDTYKALSTEAGM